MSAGDEIVAYALASDSDAEARDRLVARLREQAAGGADLPTFFHDKVQWLDCRLPDGEPELFARHLEERGYVRAPGRLRAVVDARGTPRIVSMRLRVGEYDWSDIRIGHGTATRLYRRVAYRGFVVFHAGALRISEH